MKRILASLLFLAGALAIAADEPMMSSLTFVPNVPTLAGDTNRLKLQPLGREPLASDFVFDKQEWRQIEFLPKSRAQTVQTMLSEYKIFEQAHRTNDGWNDSYVRKFDDLRVIRGNHALRKLETLLGAKAAAAPALTTPGANPAWVDKGFSLPLGGHITLYGFADDKGILVLAAYAGEGTDDARLTDTFLKLNTGAGLILVDWRQQLMLSSGAAGQVQTWQP